MHEVTNLLNYNDSLSTDGTDETERDMMTYINGGPRYVMEFPVAWAYIEVKV
jgi:hypothetical protein